MKQLLELLLQNNREHNLLSQFLADILNSIAFIALVVKQRQSIYASKEYFYRLISDLNR